MILKHVPLACSTTTYSNYPGFLTVTLKLLLFLIIILIFSVVSIVAVALIVAALVLTHVQLHLLHRKISVQFHRIFSLISIPKATICFFRPSKGLAGDF